MLVEGAVGSAQREPEGHIVGSSEVRGLQGVAKELRVARESEVVARESVAEGPVGEVAMVAGLGVAVGQHVAEVDVPVGLVGTGVVANVAAAVAAVASVAGLVHVGKGYVVVRTEAGNPYCIPCAAAALPLPSAAASGAAAARASEQAAAGSAVAVADGTWCSLSIEPASSASSSPAPGAAAECGRLNSRGTVEAGGRRAAEPSPASKKSRAAELRKREQQC